MCERISLHTWEDNGSAAHHQVSLGPLEQAGDDERLIGAAGDDPDVETHPDYYTASLLSNVSMES